MKSSQMMTSSTKFIQWPRRLGSFEQEFCRWLNFLSGSDFLEFCKGLRTASLAVFQAVSLMSVLARGVSAGIRLCALQVLHVNFLDQSSAKGPSRNHAQPGRLGL